MAFTLTSLTDLPGGQQVETHPSISFARINTLIPGADSFPINQQGATSNDWLIAVRSVVSWWFELTTLAAAPGCTFRIELCSDPGLLGFSEFAVYALPVGGVYYMTSLVLPGVAARFTLINGHPTPAFDITVSGHLKIQAGF